MNTTYPGYLVCMLIIGVSVLLGACNGGGGDTQAPTGVATLNWAPPTQNADGSALSDLAGYKIYYGSAPDQLTSIITLDNPGLTTYVIDNLSGNTTYYFAITALNAQGDESALSNQVSKAM